MPCRKKPVAMISPATSPGPPGSGDPAQQRRVVRGPGTGPGGGLQQFQFGDGGDQLLGVAQQLVDAAGGHGAAGRVVAGAAVGLPVTEGILPLGGADDHRAVLPGNDVDRHAADQSPHG